MSLHSARWHSHVRATIAGSTHRQLSASRGSAARELVHFAPRGRASRACAIRGLHVDLSAAQPRQLDVGGCTRKSSPPSRAAVLAGRERWSVASRPARTVRTPRRARKGAPRTRVRVSRDRHYLRVGTGCALTLCGLDMVRAGRGTSVTHRWTDWRRTRASSGQR